MGTAEGREEVQLGLKIKQVNLLSSGRRWGNAGEKKARARSAVSASIEASPLSFTFFF